jgi:hypothetical protein
MAYGPNEADAWNPPVAGNSSAWSTLIDNDEELYKAVPSVVMSAYGPYLSASDGSATRLFYFAVPGNFDQLTVMLHFGYQLTGGSATVTLTVQDASGSATDTVTSSTLTGSGAGAITVPMSNTTGTTTPRYAFVDATCSAGNVIAIGAVLAGVNLAGNSGPATGVLSSGYITAPAAWYTGSAPIPTELLDRLHDNPHKIAADRLQCIFSMVRPLESAVRGFSTDSAVFQAQTHIALPGMFQQSRTYRVWCYVERSSTAQADVLVTIGDRALLLTDDFGIMQGTIDVGPLLFTPAYQPSRVSIRVSSGSGSVAIRTVQILEVA